MAVVASLSESIQVSVALQRRDDHKLGSNQAPPELQKPVRALKQVLLVLVVCGMETCVTFEQIYQILILQYLGVPMSLVSINGIICGLASMVTIPAIGYVTTGGSNPQKRKMVSLFAGMAMFQIGLFLLFISGFVKISLLNELLKEAETTSTFYTTAMTDVTNINSQDRLLVVDTTGNTSAAIFLSNIIPGNWSENSWNGSNLTANPIDPESSQDGEMPITAYLAICGFAFLDIGFDTSASITRTYILESVPKFQHVKLLVLATIVQSSAGTLFALLGVLDISDALGHAFSVDGTSAILIFFSALLFLVVTFAFTSTALTGYYLTKESDKTDAKLKIPTPSLITQKIFPEKSVRRRTFSIKAEDESADTMDASKTPLLQESVPSSNYLAMNMSSSFASPALHLENSAKSDRSILSSKLHRNISSEVKAQGPTSRSSYSVTIHETDAPDLDDNSFISSLVHEKVGSKMEPNSATVPIVLKTSNDETDEKRNERARLRRKVAIISTSTFFTVGASISFLYYASNALTIGIYKGDPTALPGTEGKSLYDDGLRAAALGNLTFYILFTITSLTNQKLLELVDEKKLFIVFHLVFLIPLSVLLGTECIEAYFATVLMVGFFRHTVYTLIYVLASKISQESPDTNGGSNLGKIMSLLGFLTPTHYLILSAFMGPLIDATGNVWIPLFYTLGCGCVSVLVFSLLFVLK